MQPVYDLLSHNFVKFLKYVQPQLQKSWGTVKNLHKTNVIIF